MPIMPLIPQGNPVITSPFNPMMTPHVKQPVGEFKKVWVSHIPPGLSDSFMHKLLETCGPVASWKRTIDQNGKAKGFGFCEYTSIECMLKALRVLNHLKLEDGYELSVRKYS
jgi:RNA recognition motif-containing protein